MNDNPSQSPISEPTKSQNKHRSFRLTSSESDPELGFVVGTFRSAIVFSLICQVPVLLLGAMILDGGLIFRKALIASLAYWAMVLMIWIRNKFNAAKNISDADILLTKWGYWPMLIAVCLLGKALGRLV